MTSPIHAGSPERRGDVVASDRRHAAVEFAIRGDLRYLSHHDTLRMLTRALVRSGLPLSYSRGFNPAPRIALPVPRPLGVASEVELAWIELEREIPAAALRAALSAQLPAGCVVHRVAVGPRRRTPFARAVTYETPLEAPDAAGLAERLGELLSRETLRIARGGGPGKPIREIDIRPFVAEAALEGARLRMSLRITEHGSARPGELLGALGLNVNEYLSRTQRVHVEWSDESPFADAEVRRETERNKLDHGLDRHESAGAPTPRA